MIEQARQFIITLDRSKEKLAHTINHLRDNGILPDVFLGFDGDIFGLRTVWTYDRDNPGTNWSIGKQTICIYLSHLTLWRVCEYIDSEFFLIMEDDVRFVDGWRFKWKEDIPHLPSDWDMIFIGSCCCEDQADRTQIHGSIWKVETAQCMHAYMIRKNALRVLIRESMKKMYAHIDVNIALHALPHLNCYAFLPRLAIQNGTMIPP